MENAPKSTNPVLRLLIMVVCWMEQLTFLLFLIVALLFSVVECVCLSCCCVGGEPQVIPGRESVEDISWDTLIADINNSRDGYCFLRILKREDRVAFVRRLTESEKTAIYQRKAILLGRWVRIMQSLKLKNSYAVYRRAYWGENAGRREINGRLTNYLVPVWYFDRYEPDKVDSLVDMLTRMFHQLTFKETVIRILLDDNHMEIFESRFKTSSWENKACILPNEYYGQMVCSP